jgi:hypothetical protein
MSHALIRIQFQCAPVFLVSAFRIPVQQQSGFGHVRFGKIVIQLERAVDGRVGFQ